MEKVLAWMNDNLEKIYLDDGAGRFTLTFKGNNYDRRHERYFLEVENKKPTHNVAGDF